MTSRLTSKARQQIRERYEKCDWDWDKPLVHMIPDLLTEIERLEEERELFARFVATVLRDHGEVVTSAKDFVTEDFRVLDVIVREAVKLNAAPSSPGRERE